MNENYAKELIEKSFTFIVKSLLLNDFVYDEDTEDELMEEAEDFGTPDLQKTLEHFEISAGELRSLLYDIDFVFDVELDEEKYWAEGENNCIVSRKDTKKNPFVGMMAMMNSDTKLRPGLTFQEIADDVEKAVIAKLSH